MKMHSQQFKLIAKVVCTISDIETRRQTALNFLHELQQTNPNFKQTVFLKACGC
jgi:hypothetical protein